MLSARRRRGGGDGPLAPDPPLRARARPCVLTHRQWGPPSPWWRQSALTSSSHALGPRMPLVRYAKRPAKQDRNRWGHVFKMGCLKAKVGEGAIDTGWGCRVHVSCDAAGLGSRMRNGIIGSGGGMTMDLIHGRHHKAHSTPEGENPGAKRRTRCGGRAAGTRSDSARHSSFVGGLDKRNSTPAL